MRIPSARFVLVLSVALAIAGCLPSGPYTVVSSPAPESAPPPPPPPRVVPLEVTVVRSEAGRLLVQTNRYAYVALFEIVPGRGVALLYPGSTHQTSARLSGLSWVPVWWTIRAPSNARRYSNASGAMERYVYAIASDRPLRITDGAYDSNYMRRVLGPSAYEASSPYATVRALSRYFVPPTTDEHWGEDLYAVPASYSRESRVARVYCPDGSVFEVREELASRVYCPPDRRGRVADGPRGQPRDGTGQLPSAPIASTPDSVLGSTGAHVTRRAFDPGATTPVYRVPAEAPNETPATQPERKGTTGAQDHDDNGRRAHGDPVNADPRGRGVGIGNGGGRQLPADVIQQAKPRQGDPAGKAAHADTADKRDKERPAEASPGKPAPESSGKASEKSGQPSAEAKEKPKTDTTATPKEMRRRPRLTPAQLDPKPDSSSPKPPAGRP